MEPLPYVWSAMANVRSKRKSPVPRGFMKLMMSQPKKEKSKRSGNWGRIGIKSSQLDKEMDEYFKKQTKG